VNEWQTESNEEAGIRVRQHETVQERLAAARLCSEKLSLTIPTLVDGMDNAAAEVFAAWPERIYILNKGKIHYKGGPGPYEFNPEEAKESLMQLLNTP